MEIDKWDPAAGHTGSYRWAMRAFKDFPYPVSKCVRTRVCVRATAPRACPITALTLVQ